MQRLISWNVASVRARWPNIVRLIQTYQPDILALQEIKATEDTFPFFDAKTLGYHAYISGQKGFNGVALLSRRPLSEIKDNLMGETKDSFQARFIQGKTPEGLTVISVYVPNGNPPEKDPADTTRLQYKLKWLEALQHHLKSLPGSVVCLGDFNVIEQDTDVYNPDAYRTNALMVPEVRAAFYGLMERLQEAIRLKHPEKHYYSFWDFQMRAWDKNYGMLLDRILLTPDLVPKIHEAGVLKDVRGWEKTSDHAPVFVTLG